MDWKSAFTRARRGLREERRLYLVAVSSLSVAFLCLAVALLFMQNLGALGERWGQSNHLSVYLADNASDTDVAQLRVVLEALPEVEQVQSVSSEQARAEFIAQSTMGEELSTLPADVFPASLEIEVASGTPVQRLESLSQRLGSFGSVAEVETYSSFFERLHSLLSAGRGLAMGLALLVSLCVLAVVGNTIRLAVARRTREIEVMKLCGATDSFVRRPFVLEGAFQGSMSAFLALLLLSAAFLVLRERADDMLTALMGMRLLFLSPLAMLGLLFGGALAGAVGSALSLRRYLVV
ncbi:MAG: ABC transporter permease [Deltaproteobacteria bacterium]|nr:ABC transporter permease [Deltaproteobacteria bacterium]